MSSSTSVNVSSCRPSPTNPRKHFDKAKLEELAASVKTHGVLQGIIVRPVDGRHEIVAGERRWRAAKLAGLEQIPASIRELTDAQVIDIQLIENVQREDLTPLEEADSYKSVIDREIATAEELAVKIGKSKSHVYQRIKLCSLCKQGRTALEKGTISPSVALLVARLPTADLQKDAMQVLEDQSYDGPLTLEQATDELDSFLLRLKEAPFDVKDAQLVPAAGSCTECPKRTGAQRELFPEALKSGDACTDRKCWENKVDVHGKAVVKAARAKGLKVLEGQAASRARYDSHYVNPGDTCYDDPKQRTYKQLLGKDAPEPVVLIDGDGKITERLSAAAVTTALKEAGHSFAKASSSSSFSMAGDAQWRARRELERRVADATTEAMCAELVTRCGGDCLDVEIARALAQLAIEFCWSDAKSAVAARRKVGDGKKGNAVENALLKYASTLTLGESLGLLAEVLTFQASAKGGGGSALLAALGVKGGAIAGKVKAEMKAAKAAKKKGAR